MKHILPYASLSIAAFIFSVWFWMWGAELGPVASIQEVPEIFNASDIIGSILFFGSAWLVLKKGFQTVKTSYLVLGAICIWYFTVLFLGIGGFFAWQPLFAPNIIFAFIL